MFEDILFHRSIERRSRLSLPVALALHGAAAAAIVGASIWSVGEPPEPAIPMSWIVNVPPAPAGDVGGRRPLRRAAARSRAPAAAVARQIPAPTDTPAGPEVRDVAAEADMQASGDPGAGELGTGSGGVPGATGTGPETSGGPDREIFQPGGDVRAPELVFRVEPLYPEPARKARLEGEVILEAVITASGQVEEVRVVKSAGPLLDPSAREAVGRWRYRPATLNGRAVRVRLTVVVSFRLH